MNTYLYDEFVKTEIGNGFRLFPFGVVTKNGKQHEITPEYARRFRLPHFKPAIKLGSHEDATPAGGHIIELEVREDGLYAIPEWNEQGLKVLNDGAYRYQSPEVIWDDGGLENPEGGFIDGPLILGDALLHTPHLGDKAALYSVEPINYKEKDMAEETISLPKNIWEEYVAPLFKRSDPEKIEVVPEDYNAAKQERDEYKAKLEAIEVAKVRAAKVEQYTTELGETKADPTMAELLADVPEETADAIMKQFRALSAQIDESALTEEKGTSGAGADISDPKAAFNALVVAKSAEAKIDYNSAFDVVKAENADLFAQAFAK